MDYTIITNSLAPGSVPAQHQDSGDPQTLANEYAQRRANASDYESSAVVIDESGKTITGAWAAPQ